MNRNLLWLALALAPISGVSQIVADGATNTLSNVTNTITGDLTVGTNGSFTLLVLSSNVLVTNSVDGVIGLNATAKSNEVRLLSASSRWQIGSVLYLGSNGAANRLVVGNGATLRDNVALIGANASASNNLAVIAGSGSTWNAGVAYVGFNGAGNQLVVSNGGAVLDDFGYVGVGSSNNLAIVTGSGSTWTNSFDLQIGNSVGGNQLVVSNGGNLRNGHGYVGVNPPASNNLALITGNGSVWSNALDLEVGAFSANNQMIASNGATVFAAGHGFIGSATNANGNSVTLADPGTRWLVGTNLYVGSNGSFNRLVVSNGATARDNLGTLGFNPISSNNLAVVTGSGSLWSNASELYVGFQGAGNQLVVSTGGTVRNTSGYLGPNAGGSNTAVVTDSGSLWSNANDLFVGVFGAGDRLVVSNGAMVLDNYGFVGLNASSSNNAALVTGFGSVWTNAQDLYIGDFSLGNQLVVSNGGTVFTAGKGFIGFNSTASSNSVIVTDPGTRWMGGLQSDFYVGSNSPFNRLVVSNGGLVADNPGFFGHGASGNSNLVLVTGAGSIWSNRNILEMGERGSGNRLVISNGGLVHASGFSRIGRISGTNNEAVVTGPGSLWNVPFGTIRIGESASSNRVEINNGGSVRSQFAELGDDVGSNNEALVTGPGSVWTNSETFSVGLYGNRNRLVVSNAATVFSGTSMTIGEQTIGTNNRVVVDGGALLVTNAAGTGVLEARRGTNVLNAGLIEMDQLLVTNRLGFFEFNGGTLITHGAFISNNAPFFVGLSGATPAVWDVRAGVTNHVITDFLDVGFNVSSCQLLVTNGASLSNAFGGTLGVSAGVKSNTATISGIGSRWEIGGDLDVGFGGSFDRLIVSNGGLVLSSNVSLSTGSSASNNLALVTEPGSILTNQATIFVGYSGASNQMTVSNAGFVANSLAQMGFQPESSNNLATIVGQGSLWTNSGDFYIGVSGPGNRLVVTNGGILRDSNGRLGANNSSSNNLALVTGLGSLWSNRNELHVGDSSTGNQLVVSNGGTVFAAAESIIGDGNGANSNSVLISDTGSTWLGTGGLFVGNNGSFNRLIVSNGGLIVISAELSRVGSSSGANSNQVLVTGNGSTWSNQFDLIAGDAGNGNAVIVSNAATTVARMGLIGNGTGTKSNSVIVTELGSSWVLLSTLQVGSGGAFNRAVVANGALMVSSNAFIGFTATGSNNEALVSGTNSFWSNRVELNLGQSAGGNRLTVTNGGRVSSSFGFVGLTASSRSNIVTVTGGGSLWVVSNSLTLGFGGDQNRMIVNDGGAVRSGFGTLNTRSNEVVITNAGSSWRVDSLEVGSLGIGNRLVVSDGGRLDTLVASLGSQPAASSSNNEVVVTGPGASWTNLGDLFVGRFASANRLVVSNGALCISTRFSIGDQISSSNNRVVVDGGTLRATNGSTAQLDIRRGTNLLNAGLIDVNLLLLTNTLSFFEFNGGTLKTAGTTNSNGRVFKVGNGISPAILQLEGGTHFFASNLLLTSNATLIGNGTIIGALTVGSGSVLSPGTSIGKLILSNSPTLQGTTVMEIQKNPALTNDQIQVASPLIYGGSLVVTNIGTNALTVGDRYQLFNASSYAGSFSSTTLPPLPSGFIWTNKLAVDGSLEVTLPAATLTIQRSNNVLTLSWPTNALSYCLETAFDVTPPVLWQPVTGGIVTNASSFLFSLTNTLGTPKQFFRLAFPCSTAPAPSLFIQLNNNLVTVSWPSNAFRLEATFGLAPPISWQIISNGLSDSGSFRSFSFTNNPAIPNQFFRLAFP